MAETAKLRAGAATNGSLAPSGAGARAALAGGIRLEARLHCTGMDATGSSAGLSLLTPPQGGAALLEVGYRNGQLYAAHPHVCESCPPHTPVRQTAPVSLGPGGGLELAVLVDAGVVETFALPHIALTSLADLSAFAGDRAVSPSMFSSTAWRSGGGSCEFSSWALQKPDAR